MADTYVSFLNPGYSKGLLETVCELLSDIRRSPKNFVLQTYCLPRGIAKIKDPKNKVYFTETETPVSVFSPAPFLIPEARHCLPFGSFLAVPVTGVFFAAS
ncbi:MAG: hypothetical protein JJU35_13005 [Balneolales bacterium]|nr:hypothetical protein [Balneolales bacterium]